MTHSGGKPHTNVALTSACHGLSAGDLVRVDLPRPTWWRFIALWRWWRSPLRNRTWRVTDTPSTTEVRLDVNRVGSNPPPPVGAKPLPPPCPPAPGQPLTAGDVRKIVREEIERAIRPASKSGRMGPG